jgi:tRNA-specific 2-thiouridylase
MFKSLSNFFLLKKYLKNNPYLKQGNGKKVFVGLSGGVDSSVSAAILKRLGYDVEGVFIKVWQPDWMTCTWKEDKRDAMRVAADLEIPFHFLDLSDEYKENVVDYMVEEYKKGRTPNPDVMCNRSVKFGGFYDWAKRQDKDSFVATGHYASNHFDEERQEQVMMRGVDKNKDQTYFLWQIRKEQLASIIFPLGHIPKKDTRKLAEYFDLHNKYRKDSQGLCFIGHVDMGEFLGHFMELQEGDVLDTDGKIVGKHKGSEVYTLGQRGGIQFIDQADDKKALYIVAKDVKKNELIVSEDKDFYTEDSDIITLEDCNWRHDLPRACTAHIRYHGKDLPCSLIEQTSEIVRLKIEILDDSITPGQSVVLYQNGVCLGGGIVKS